MRTTMQPAIRAASAFTGIAGFERGFEEYGIETQCMIEWDPACRKVLTEHYPTTALLEDISDVRGTDLGPGVELFYGGFPCQDTSIAAPHRSGLAGSRSGHFYEFTRLVGEYARIVDEADNPRWVVIENPTGLLRSNDGRDMATVIGTLVDLGYGVSWRVVDGRHLGTPQRRERVLVVGHRGGDPRPAWEVLGDPRSGGEAAPTHHVGGTTPRLRVVREPAARDDGVKVWRKSARARKSIEAGGYETWVSDGMANTLTGFDGGLATRQTHLLRQRGRLRTLTLTEWERLQGFPDDWTAMVSSDSARYTMLGNAMHVGMARWFAARLTAVHQAVPLIA